MQRMLRIDPNVPARVETLTIAAGAWSTLDIGKPMKLDGDEVTICTDGDEIYGFLEAVEPYTQDGADVAAVRADANTEAYVADEAGTLSVGDLVAGGTPTAVGTVTPANGANVKVVATPADAIHKWQVIALYSTGAGRQALVRKL